MAKNETLEQAQRANKDELYTQLSDIEIECNEYKKKFKNKTVLCNCDDPCESSFFKYFVINFNDLGLKKLITTSYASSPVMYTKVNPLDASAADSKKSYKTEITEVGDDVSDDDIDINSLFSKSGNSCTILNGDGDFRSEECLELLDEADIVCTNPPLSLFREYVATLMEHKKNFIIIGNRMTITYKEIFPLLKDNQLWLGANINSSAKIFYVYGDMAKKTNIKTDDDGNCVTVVSSSCWFTNLDHKKRHEIMKLEKHYDPELYPKYDNYDAINVDKTADIPCDYDGVMGVPIIFMEKYCPEQFDIVTLPGLRVDGLLCSKSETQVNGKSMFARILIKKKDPE